MRVYGNAGSITGNTKIFDRSVRKVLKVGQLKRKRIYWKDLEKPYQDFCRDRKNMVIQTTRMPSYGKKLFDKRIFDKDMFIVEGN